MIGNDEKFSRFGLSKIELQLIHTLDDLHKWRKPLLFLYILIAIIQVLGMALIQIQTHSLNFHIVFVTLMLWLLLIVLYLAAMNARQLILKLMGLIDVIAESKKQSQAPSSSPPSAPVSGTPEK